MKQSLLEFWQGRNQRERWILALATGLVALLLIDQLLWQPLAKTQRSLRASVPELRNAAVQLRADAAEVARLKSSTEGKLAPGTSLRDGLTQLAGANGIGDELNDIQDLGGGRVSVKAANVGFAPWVNWLVQAQAQYGARMESGQIDALPEPGMVKLQIVLSRPN